MAGISWVTRTYVIVPSSKIILINPRTIKSSYVDTGDLFLIEQVVGTWKKEPGGSTSRLFLNEHEVGTWKKEPVGSTSRLFHNEQVVGTWKRVRGPR